MPPESAHPMITRSVVQSTTPSEEEGQWHTLTNPQGQKLHVVNPADYTEDELAWLQSRHNKGLSSKTGTTYAPKDPRTAAIDGLIYQIANQQERTPYMFVPDFYTQETRRLEAELLAQVVFYPGSLQDVLRSWMMHPQSQWNSDERAAVPKTKPGWTGLHSHPRPETNRKGSG